MTTAATVREALRELDALVERCRAELAAGGVIDAAPVAERVTQICAQIRELPTDEGRRLRPVLVALLDEMTSLTQGMESALQNLARELGETGKRREAVSAYGRPPAGRK